MGIHLITPIYEVIIKPKPPGYGPPVTAYFYPDPHPEVTSVDGCAWRTAASPYTWADLHDGAGVTSADSGADVIIQIRCYTTTDCFRSMIRTILLFDTSSIPVGSLITEAKLRVRCENKFATNGLWANFSVCVYESNPASNTALVPADYQALFTTPLAQAIAYADIAIGADQIFTFNAAGLAKVIAGGISKLGIREAGYDAPNNNPGWSYGRSDLISWWAAEDTDILKRPRLEVTYQPPA